MRDPWHIGGACCSMLAVCDEISDFDRAAQWCRVVVDFTRRKRYVPLFAWCRSAYAGVLTATGEWELAEQELEASLRAYGGPGQPMAAYPLARLAELRLRQGRVEEAARLVAGYESHAARRAGRDRGAARARGGRPRAQDARAPAGDARRASTPRRRRCCRCWSRRCSRRGTAWARAPRRTGCSPSGGRSGARAWSRRRSSRPAGWRSPPPTTPRSPTSRSRSTASRGSGCRSRKGAQGWGSRGRSPPRRRTPAGAEARRALALFERLGALRDADAAAAFLRSLGGAGRSAPRLEGSSRAVSARCSRCSARGSPTRRSPSGW